MLLSLWQRRKRHDIQGWNEGLSREIDDGARDSATFYTKSCSKGNLLIIFRNSGCSTTIKGIIIIKTLRSKIGTASARWPRRLWVRLRVWGGRRRAYPATDKATDISESEKVGKDGYSERSKSNDPRHKIWQLKTRYTVWGRQEVLLGILSV